MNRSFPPAKVRVKPESAFLENLIGPIDRLTESLFCILILLTFTMTSWILGLSGSHEHSHASENIVVPAIALLAAVLVIKPSLSTARSGERPAPAAFPVGNQ